MQENQPAQATGSDLLPLHNREHLTHCISLWYSSRFSADLKALQQVIINAQKIIRTQLPALEDIYNTQCLWKAINVCKASTSVVTQLIQTISKKPTLLHTYPLHSSQKLQTTMGLSLTCCCFIHIYSSVVIYICTVICSLLRRSAASP